MSGKVIHSYLPLFACLLLFTQCDVIRYLTTEPDGTGSTRTTRTERRDDKPAADSDTAPAPGEPVSTDPTPNAEMRLRQDIVSYAKEQLGTKYKYAGRSPRTGFDCSGFTYYVMDEFGVDLSTSSRAQENQGRKIKVSEAKTGDLIFFRRSKNGAVFHVALVVSNDREGLRVIHSTSRGVVIDNLSTSSYWKPKISTARDVL
jgi:cell wall-associated NlpC family hydrolase